ncbi:hypothetical protein SLS56_010069 [Neofusicoccum ribis]|uniref:Uncharacterized protein n=1 Tax=Neofusicoccum ribis TaxID=45134 RepID=A0ABR3SGY0_9PEZI
MVCFFEGPNLPSSINGAIPTFGVNPSNTNFLAATGSFTNRKDEICTFPKSYTGNKDGENTITPYIMGDFVTRGATARATLPCKGLNGAKTYTSFQCPQVTYNRMAQGTFTMFFVAPTGPEFKPYVFAVSSPTTATDYVYETAISSTTLAPAPTITNFITQTSGTSTITITLSPEPSTTVTDTAYSATVPTTVFQTLAGRTETIFESSTTTTTISREGQPSSTTTETEYTGASVTTEYSTAMIKLSIEHLFYHIYVRFFHFHFHIHIHFYVRILHSFRINLFHSDHYFHQYEYGVFDVDHFLNNFGYSNPSGMPWL